MSTVHTRLSTPLGPIIIEGTTQGVESIVFQNDATRHAPTRSGSITLDPTHPVNICRRQLEEYFAGKRRSFSVPLTIHGTPFQMKTWQQLQAVPFGRTETYSGLAASAKHPRAFRAVGSAMRKNKLCIVVPCHRIVPATGARISATAGNYAYGTRRKAWLLEHEWRFATKRTVRD